MRVLYFYSLKYYNMARRFLFLLISIISIMSATIKNTSAQENYLFIGTYAPANKNSLFVYKFNTANGEARQISTVSDIENPSFFCISSDRQYLYAVSETHGGEGGHVVAFHFNKKTGILKKLNEVLSKGDDPCYIHLDKTGKWLFVANYNSGSLAVFPVEKSGQVGEAVQVITHHGRSIHLPQQSQAHVHCTLPSPDNKYVLVADLGMDKIFTYTFNDKTGTLAAADPPYVEVTAGTGPRHLLFSRDAKYVYAIHELGDIITVFKNNHGKLSEEQIISTAPPGYHERNWAAEIHFSSDGKFLYATNRDDLNDMVVYAVNQRNGKLSYLNRYSTGGKTLRYFMISPDGKYVLIGQRNGDDIILYQRNKETGLLSPLKERIPVAEAVCMVMVAEK